MASKTRNISLPPQLDRSIRERVRSGLYGNASDVIRAGLRALAREEMAASYQQFSQIMAGLPQEPITTEIEQSVVRMVRKSREAARQKAGK
jgi:antitoxin ParD1/3/4